GAWSICYWFIHRELAPLTTRRRYGVEPIDEREGTSKAFRYRRRASDPSTAIGAVQHDRTDTGLVVVPLRLEPQDWGVPAILPNAIDLPGVSSAPRTFPIRSGGCRGVCRAVSRRSRPAK